MRASVRSPAGPVTVVGVHLTKFYFDDFANREIERTIVRTKDLSGPVVLGGDFNTAIWSRPLRELVAKAGFSRMPHEPATWPVALGDHGIAIDHVFVKGGIAVASVSSVEPTGSNHRGVAASLLVPPAGHPEGS